jgi:acetyl-CoA carboxylase biotin carboxyl carrier protein
MDDVKITIRTTLEGNVTETTYVTNASQNPDASNGSTSVTCTVVEVPVVEETKYNKIQSLELFIESLRINQCLLR